jgi:Fe-S-cluster containining protein
MLSEPPDPGDADCVACGRCCHHGPWTVHLVERDEERMGAELLARYTVIHERSGFRFMRNEGARCAGLDVSVEGRFPCFVYERRPEDCRVVAVGAAVCLEARRLGRLGRVS